MRLAVLASGSTANAIWIEHEGASLVIDAGLRPHEVRERAAPPAGDGLPLAVLVSHEHRAHAAYADDFAALGVPLRGTGGTLRALEEQGVRASGLAPLGARERLGPFDIETIPVPHAAAEPSAFIVGSPSARIGVLTDCGYAAPAVAAAFAGVDVLVLEANHEPDLLRSGPYPPLLKRKVGGRLGHLANGEAGAMLRLMGRPSPRVVILAHLSRVNNRPRLARAAVERACPGAHTQFAVAPPVGMGPTVTLEKGRVVMVKQAGRQLSLRLMGRPSGAGDAETTRELTPERA